MYISCLNSFPFAQFLHYQPCRQDSDPQKVFRDVLMVYLKVENGNISKIKKVNLTVLKKTPIYLFTLTKSVVR